MTTVLYLEDDEDDMFVFDKAMNEINHACNVIYATKDFDLFKILKRERPDIIFLDFNKPGLNGIECLKKLRSVKRWQHIPVVMYSTYINEKLLEECARESANLYVQKPGHYHKVVEVLRDVMTRNWDA